MKFKVWDKVRLTREILYEYACMNRAVWASKELIIKRFEWDYVVVNNTDWSEESRKEEALELVPEEPEFEYGEEIEVSDTGTERGRRIFLHKVLWNAYSPYICTDWNNLDIFKNWDWFYTNSWKYARKLKPQLTRKEIAEKFWVSEDFTLID